MNLIASCALSSSSSSFCHISASTQKLVKRRKSSSSFPHTQIFLLLALATETVELRVQKHERTGEEGEEELHGAFFFLSFD